MSDKSPNAANRQFTLEHTRNIGIAAHIDAGKTTLTERILYYTGMIHKVGEVHDGAATTDHMPQERERGITITSAAVTCEWKQTAKQGIFQLFNEEKQRINIIDTPGHVDFTAEVERSLRVLDGAIVVFCAVAGVQPQTETVWRQATKYQVPRMIFVNKMDRVGANFDNVIQEVREKLGALAVPILIPIGSEENLKGQIDVVNQKAIIYEDGNKINSNFSLENLTGDLQEQAELAKQELIETLADVDEELAEKFLMEEEITARDLKSAIRRSTISNLFVPVSGGSAFKNKGVHFLMDAIIDYLPSPLDIPAAEGQSAKDETKIIKAETNDNHKFCALAFKLWADKFVGKLVFFRVYSGSVSQGDMVYNPRTQKKERVSRLIQIQADAHKDVKTCYAGDIAAIVGLKNATTGDTLCDAKLDLLLEPPSFPEPVIALAVEPRSSVDQDKMAIGLTRLQEEDPTFIVKSDPDTGQTIIAGMGELHLDVIIDRLKREFQVEAKIGKPQIAYRETITTTASAKGEFIKQSGGSGQYAKVDVKVTPKERGEGLSIDSKVVGGAIPKEFIGAVKEGIEQACINGNVAGYPVVDLHVDIISGDYHEEDSNDNAFKMAAIFAMRHAFDAAQSTLLEPIMDVEIETPEAHQGDILGDLNRRRGQIEGLEAKPTFCTLKAKVPLATMFGYMTTLRSLSTGRASFSMEPLTFEIVPPAIVKELTESRGY